MNISYNKLHNEAIVIEELCIRCHIWQHLNDSQLIDKVYYVYTLQENDDDISIDIYYIVRVD